MRRLCKYGMAQGLSSCLPILMWFLVSIVYGNKDYANIMTITYVFQCVWGLLYNILICGCLIYEDTHNLGTRDFSWSATYIAAILFAGISAVICINMSSYFQFMGLSVGAYSNFFVLSLGCLSINLLLIGVSTILQYNGQEGISCTITLKYYSLQCIVIVISKYIIYDERVDVVITLSTGLLYVMHLIRKYSTLQKFRIDCWRGIRYRLPNIVSGCCLIIIYTIGLKSVTNQPEIILISYNLAILCTDMQWDVLNVAIDTDTSIKVCSDTYLVQEKQTLVNGVLLAFMLILSSVVLTAIGAQVYIVDYVYLFWTIVFEIALFPLYAVRYSAIQYLSIRHPSILLVGITAASYILRTVLSLSLTSPYRLSVSVFIASGLFGNIAFILLYVYTRRKQYNESVISHYVQ